MDRIKINTFARKLLKIVLLLLTILSCLFGGLFIIVAVVKSVSGGFILGGIAISFAMLLNFWRRKLSRKKVKKCSCNMSTTVSKRNSNVTINNSESINEKPWEDFTIEEKRGILKAGKRYQITLDIIGYSMMFLVITGMLIMCFGYSVFDSTKAFAIGAITIAFSIVGAIIFGVLASKILDNTKGYSSERYELLRKEEQELESLKKTK